MKGPKKTRKGGHKRKKTEGARPTGQVEAKRKPRRTDPNIKPYVREGGAKRKLSKDKFKEMRKVSKEKKKSNSRMKKPDKNYSMIVDQIDQNYESRGKVNYSQYYNDQEPPRYRPSHIKEKILPPSLTGQRHMDLASYREARKQQKLKQKYEHLAHKGHYSMLEPETGSTTHGQDLINMSYQMPVKILEEDEFQNKINNIGPRAEPQEVTEDLIGRRNPKKKDKKGLYKSGHKKKKKAGKNPNLSGTKKSYTSFMKSGNFEKEFMEEINYDTESKDTHSAMKTSLDTNKPTTSEKKLFSGYQKPLEVSNLNSESNRFQSEDPQIQFDSFPINPEEQAKQEQSSKDVVNIYHNSNVPHPIYAQARAKHDKQLGSDSDIQRVSELERDSRFYEYSEVGSLAVDMSRKSRR